MKTATLDENELRSIFDSLLIGLAAFAEIDRIHTRVGHGAEFEKLRDDDLLPTHPTANSDTVGDFVDSLRYVNSHLSRLAELAP